ncbi:MAG: ribonuclease III [Acidobacteria bacterium]|nr:ribonuclease III [Acidobacteriota bacterium]
MEGLSKLEAAIGYRFENPELLTRALTHKSHAFETSSQQPERLPDNEQLEFLGDSILGFLISEMLVQRFPDYVEGQLSKLKAYLVSATHLHSVAVAIELGEYLYLGRGEEMSGGRSKRALLADGVEALIAAIYTDSGMDPVRQFVTGHVVGSFDEQRNSEEGVGVDFKSALQEAALSRGLPMPRYLLVRETGPEHSKMFTVEARVGPAYAERAEGTSKKTAGQRAARQVLESMTQTAAASSNGDGEESGYLGVNGGAVDPPKPA